MSTGEIETLLSSRERLDRFIEQAAVVRRAEAEMLHPLAKLDKEGAPVEFGYCGSAATLAQDVLRISRAEARRMAERARVLFGALGISGEPLSRICRVPRKRIRGVRSVVNMWIGFVSSLPNSPPRC